MVGGPVAACYDWSSGKFLFLDGDLDLAGAAMTGTDSTTSSTHCLKRLAGGFTLLEMAIAVALFGLITSGAMVGLSVYFKRQAQIDTAAILPPVERAITLYVLQNGELPCPDTAAGGIDGLADDTACTAAGAGEIVQGVVPWRSLGLQREEVTDAWNHYIDLIVAVELATGSAAMDCTGGSLPYPTIAGLGVIEATDDPAIILPAAAPLAAYALISHGANGFGGALSSGNRFNPGGGSAEEQHHSQDGVRLASNGFPAAQLITGFSPGYQPGREFDDKIRSRTPAQILYDMGCING